MRSILRAHLFLAFPFACLVTAPGATPPVAAPEAVIQVADDPPPQAVLPTFTSSTYPYFVTLKHYTFDDGATADPQGWTTHDLTVQDGTFWHIDDFVGLSEPYTPISGAKSMWCGLASDPGYELLPGYGNRWTQILESNVFSVGIYEPVYIEYAIKHDFVGADRVDLEYRSAITGWKPLATYSGTDLTGTTMQSYVPTVDVFQTIQFRFVMTSGIYNSDEDFTNTMGAVILDDPLVYHGSPPILVGFDFFDSYPNGSTNTFQWHASTAPAFGNYAGLVSGAGVLQAGTANTSHVWSFFNGSSETYACNGYPAQAAVPKTASPGSTRLTDYLCNEVRSPFIDLSVDEYNQPVNSDFGAITFEFDVYSDLPAATNKVMYSMRTRFMVGGVPEPWLSSGYVFYTNTAQWSHWDPSSFTTHSIPAGATHVQIGLIAIDNAYSTGATGMCHSQSPLFDNVTIHRLYSPHFVTNTDDSGDGSLRQALTSANASATTFNSILFSIPGDGPHTINLASPLPVVTGPVWIDGFSQSGAEPNQSLFLASTDVLKVALNGTAAGPGANGIDFAPGSYGVIRGLAIGGFQGAGIRSQSTGLIVNGCHVGTDAAGTTAVPNGNGIERVSGQTDIGGPATVERMVIAGNTGDGIRVLSGAGPIVHCYVGTDPNGNAMGNGGHGIHVVGGAFCSIGAPYISPCDADDVNQLLIANNAGDGIRIAPAASVAYVAAPRIFGNGGMNIDLGGDGPTANDYLDSDSGPNGLQNHPVLINADGISIGGEMSGVPNLLHRVEFFRGTGCGNAPEYLGYVEVTTDGTGHVPISFTCDPIPPASTLTATATNGYNTSEYAPCILSINTPPGAPLVDLYDASKTLRAQVSFDYVPGGGNTFLSPATPPVPVPANWDVGPNPSYWDITSDATFANDDVHVALVSNVGVVPGPENMLRLLHYDGQNWVDVTTDVDTLNHRIGGRPDGLSPFVLAVPTGATGVADDVAPVDFALHANIPNPFNPVTTIQYDVPAGGADVNIAVFDVSGRLVRTLVDEHRDGGRFSARWNGEDGRGGRVASGVYFYRMRAGDFTETRKMVLLK